MNSTETATKLGIAGLAAAQADLASLLRRRAKSQAADDDFNRRLQETQARQQYGEAWPAAANDTGDEEVNINIDSPTTVYYERAPSAAAQGSTVPPVATPAGQQAQTSQAGGFLKKALVSAALLAAGGGATAAAPWVAGLLTSKPAVETPASAAVQQPAQPAPVNPLQDFRLELVPEAAQ